METLVFFSRAPTVGDNLIFIGTSYVVEKGSSENNDVCELSTASRTRGILYVFVILDLECGGALVSIFVLKGIDRIL